MEAGLLGRRALSFKGRLSALALRFSGLGVEGVETYG